MGKERFQVWTKYWGLLNRDPASGSALYGFENCSFEHKSLIEVEISERVGGIFGYVASGAIRVPQFGGVRLGAGMWFSFVSSEKSLLEEDSSVFIVHSPSYVPLNTIGGGLEKLGRLKYIDGCSDTVLCFPAKLGDPCLNHLHFPKETRQTKHFHPSVRYGCIAGTEGAAYCMLEDGEVPLVSGAVFSIPSELNHAFRTTSACMDVVAFHPDSDWGPEDEDHPMINRTIRPAGI